MKTQGYLWVAAVAIFLALSLQACQTNPFTVAKTPEQKGYLLYGTFVILEEQGAKAVVDPTVSPVIKTNIRLADNKAKPVADSMHDALSEYITISRQLAQGTTTQDKVNIATANLNQWVVQATPLINDLVTAVGGK